MSAVEALTPPHSEQAEQAVLGAVLVDNRVFDVVGDVLLPERFYFPQHRAIYSTMARLLSAQKPADVVTVFEAGGHDLAFLNALASSVTGTRNARRYAEIIAERWQRRELLRIAADLTDAAHQVDAQAQAVPEVIDTALGKLFALGEQRAEQGPQTMYELLPTWIDEFNDMAEGKLVTFRTGLADLDALTGGGGRRGELWVLGARPSMGKSASALTFALNLSRETGTLVLSQEDSRHMFLSRSIAHLAKINLAHLRNPMRAAQIGELDAVWPKLNDGTEELGQRHLMLDDQGGLTLSDVRRKVLQAKRRMPGLGLVVVDYLQLMSGEAGDNRNQMLGAVANGLNKLAKDENIWILLLSQLSRKADERPGVPQMSDLRDSGDIEGAAHVILLLHREHMRKPDVPGNWAQVHVCKQKNGPTGTVNAFFDGAHQAFTDWFGPVPVMSKSTKSAVVSGGLD